MGDTVQKKIEFVFGANDQALKEAAGKADGILKGLDDRLQASTKALKQSFNLEALAKSGLMVSAAINAVDVASQALSGDIQQAAEAVKQLPLGVGQMAGALERVLGLITGIGQELKYLNDLEKANAAIVESATAAWAGRIKAMAATEDRARTLREDTELTSLEGYPRRYKEEQLRIDRERRERTQKHLDDLAKGRDDASKAALAKLQEPVSQEEVMAWYAKNPGQNFGGNYQALEQAVIADRNQRIRESDAARLAREEAKLRAKQLDELRDLEANHAAKLHKIDEDLRKDRIAALKKWGEDSVKTTKAFFEEMAANIKDPPKSWARRLYDLIQDKEKKPAARRADTADDAGVEARDRRLAGWDWGAEFRPPEDQQAYHRRTPRIPQRWDRDSGPRHDSDPAMQDLTRQIVEMNAVMRETTQAVREHTRELVKSTTSNPAMEGF